MSDSVKIPDFDGVGDAEVLDKSSRSASVGNPYRCPSRTGIFLVKVAEVGAVPNKSGDGNFNLYTKLILQQTGDDSEEDVGIIIRSWKGISGAYSEKSRKRAGMPKILEVYDLARSVGYDKSKLDADFARGKVLGSTVSKLLTYAEGRLAYASIGVAESEDEDGKTWWNPELIVMPPKEDAEAAIASNAYRRPLPPDCAAWVQAQLDRSDEEASGGTSGEASGPPPADSSDFE